MRIKEVMVENINNEQNLYLDNNCDNASQPDAGCSSLFGIDQPSK